MRKQARRNLLAALLLLAGISWTRTRPQIPMESSAPPTPAVTLTPSPESWRRVDNQCFEFTWSCEIPDSLLWESDVMGASGTYRPNSGFVVHKYPVAGPLTEELLVRRQHNEESYRDTQPVTDAAETSSGPTRSPLITNSVGSRDWPGPVATRFC